MEFSLAQSLEGYTEQYNVPFPSLKSDPASDYVNPGIGQVVNLFETIVPLTGRSIHSIQKHGDESKEEVTVLDDKSQIGAGKSSINSSIMSSFMHPIVTDSIVFPKQPKDSSKTKSIKRDSESEPQDPKRRKIEHKFHVV